jgi:hypothetical protein
MMSSGTVPHPKILQRSLRKVTETLACELATPTERAPEWSALDWSVARAVAAMHGISPLLLRTLRWQGPASFSEFLEQQAAHTATRHGRMQELLRRIDARANEAGIAAVALKGPALHALGLYNPGERPMADIDLLVRPGVVESAAAVLVSLGFRQVKKSWKERVFAPSNERTANLLGEHADNDLIVELHERIGEKLPWRITDVSELVFTPQAHAGLNAYASKASLMIHLLLHAAGSMPIRALRVLQLHDLALLSSCMTEPEWSEVLAQGARGPRFWWAYPPLKLASRYYPSKIPSEVLDALAAQCPYLLRRVAAEHSIYDVSYSYPWVDAFPGIEWSQSLAELVGYVASRVRPAKGHQVLRDYDAKTQPISQNQWAGLSQSRRMLRWATSRPTRPLTMHAVATALARAQ